MSVLNFLTNLDNLTLEKAIPPQSTYGLNVVTRREQIGQNFVWLSNVRISNGLKSDINVRISDISDT